MFIQPDFVVLVPPGSDTQCEVPRQTPEEPLPPFAVGSDHQAPVCACPFTVPAFPWSTSGILCVRDGADLSRDVTLH